MTERSAHDDALADQIWAARHDLIDLDTVLTNAWSKVTRIDASAEFRAQTAERCLTSARALSDLAQTLTRIEGGT